MIVDLLKKMIALLSIQLIFFNLSAQMTEITNFGTNPGNLKMFLFQPSMPQNNAGVVLVMHGCGQNAADFANQTGWNVLAEQYGFYAIHAEQKAINNPTKCFNWFNATDNIRNSGESLSLIEMVSYVTDNFAIDSTKIFACGLSAGGSMTPVMMACYPDIFSAGGVWAGVPYLYQPSGTNNDTPMQWGDKVRNAYVGYTGDYPHLFICQGTNDAVVDSINRSRLVAQWTNVHGTNQAPNTTNSNFNGNMLVEQNLYLNSSLNDTIIETFTIDGMGHGIAVDPGTGTHQGGVTSVGAHDVNFYSTYWMACFFGLIPKQFTNINEQINSNITITNLQDGSIKITHSSSGEKMVLSVVDISGRLISRDNFNKSIVLSTQTLPQSVFVVIVQSSKGTDKLSKVFIRQ